MRGIRDSVIATTAATLLASCAMGTKAQPGFEHLPEIVEAIRVHGSPLSAKQVSSRAEQLVGKTILLEGFLRHYCDEYAKPDCTQIDDRYVVFGGDQLRPRPGPLRQPCPISEKGIDGEVVVGGNLPASFGQPRNRRTLLLGTVSRRSVSIPMVTAHGSSGTSIDFVQDFVLDNVTVLALYDSRCDWPN
jgi:hypothetical protein